MRQVSISTIATYEDDEGFRVDIVHNTEDDHPTYEAYIYHALYGVKEFMYGMLDTDVTLEQFTEMVLNDVTEYSAYYDEDYMSRDDHAMDE